MKLSVPNIECVYDVNIFKLHIFKVRSLSQKCCNNLVIFSLITTNICFIVLIRDYNHNITHGYHFWQVYLNIYTKI